MSKILLPNEIGFGILIEEDAGYIGKDLNPKMLSEGFQLKPDVPVLVNCILQKWGVENKNGRIYPKEILVPQVEIYQQLVDTNSAVSEADHPDCVWAEESEILTKNGWKYFKDILEDEEIQTLNVKTNTIETQKINKRIYEDYDNKMYRFNSRSIDLTVTPNHRFLLEDNNGKRFYMPAQEIYENVGGVLSSGKNKILKKANWKCDDVLNFTLKGVPNDYLGKRIKHTLRDKYVQDIIINADVWFAFMGIYLADGHYVETGKGYEIAITQQKPHTKKLIDDLLKKLPFNYRKSNGYNGRIQYAINDARLYKYLSVLGKADKKYIPSKLKNLSIRQLKILFDWFQLGDGRCINTKNKTKKQSVFTISKKLINDLHEILIKIGGNGNITIQNNHKKDSWIKDKKKILILEDGTEEIIYEKRIIKKENRKPLYNLHISNTKHIWLDKRMIEITEIHKKGKIACVTVGNSNFMVRVNGKSHWTGNSSVVSLHNFAHIIKKMWWGTGDNEHVLYGQLEIITSPAYVKQGIVSMIGDKVVEYLKRGIQLGISSRGVGTLDEVDGKNIVQDDFELICFDLVASPSTPGAFLFPNKNEMQVGEGMASKNILSTQIKKQKPIETLSNSQQIIVDGINRFLI